MKEYSISIDKDADVMLFYRVVQEITIYQNYTFELLLQQILIQSIIEKNMVSIFSHVGAVEIVDVSSKVQDKMD